MTRYELVKQIQKEFEDKFTVANGYQIEPIQVLVGLNDPLHVTQYPSLAVQLVSDPMLVVTSDDDIERIATFVVAGYFNDAEDMYKMCDDVEKFLYSSNFIYYESVELNPEGATFPASGIGDYAGLYTFDFMFIINYTQEF